MKRNLNFMAFTARLALMGSAYETKDSPPTMAEINEGQKTMMVAFEAFKKSNDARIDELEKKGSVDPVTAAEFKAVSDGLAEAREELKTLAKAKARPGGDGEKDRYGKLITADQAEHSKAFEEFLRAPDDHEKAKAVLSIQKKQVATLTDGAGGYAVPEVLARRIEREVSEASDLTQIVDTVMTGSKDYKELVDVRGATYAWAGEGDTRTATDTPNLDEVVPTFGMLYAYPTATEESMDDIFFNVGNWLANSATEAFVEGIENAIIGGNGVKKPTGFMNGLKTDEKDGNRAFGTLQYLATGTADGYGSDPADTMVNLIQELKKKYRRRARWLMTKRTVGDVMTFKDGDGNYLWKMGDIKSGQPDRLLGYGITESEEMPDKAADAFPIAFGDFKAGYMFNPLVGLRITRDEITQPGFIKWYIRRRVGGTLKMSEAIKLLRIALN